jgi:two-component system NarL family sensor kinase
VRIFFSIWLVSILQITSIVGFSQPYEPDSLLTSTTGVKRAEAYYSVVFLNLRKDLPKAIYYMKEYESIAQKGNDQVTKAYVQLNRGTYYSAIGNLDSATYHLEEAKRVAGKKNDLLLIRTESSLGKVYISSGKPEKGLENLFEALGLLQSNPDKESEIKVRINITWAYLELKRYKDCVQFGRKTLNIVSPELTWMLPYIYNNVAVSYGALNQIDSAKYFIEKSIPIAEANNDNNMIANAHFILGTIYSNSGKYELAIDQYQQAKPYREKIGNPLFIVSDLYTLSSLYAKTGSYAKGIEAGLEGLRLAEQHNLLLKFEGVYESLATNYEGINDYKNASKYYNLWAHAKDSVYKNATANAIAEMETKYETEKKELLINEQQLKLEKNQAITIGLIVLLVLVIIVIILWRNQLKLKEQRKLEQQQREHQENLTKAVINLQEKERSRFAKDLHDGFGQLITALKMQFDKIGHRSDGASELIQHMHDEIRNVSFALSPQVLVRDGLVQAVKELSFRINRSNGFQVIVQTTGFNERLHADFEITLYRICQEWINNVMKYSEANRADVQLIEHSDEVTLMIEDDGKGFDLIALETGKGNGWKNIQSRIQILKGTVEVDSKPGRVGTTFTASIPLQ